MLTSTLTESLRGAPVTESAHADPEARAARPLLGNDHELDQTYEQHFAFVWRSLRRLGVPVDLLDDAAQDVFIVALRRAGDFRQRSSYRTWLFGIACNVAREQRKKARRIQTHDPLDEGLSSIPSTRACAPRAKRSQLRCARAESSHD
jgi:RNA polymerase sigma-70 factor (ECF subfamily)